MAVLGELASSLCKSRVQCPCHDMKVAWGLDSIFLTVAQAKALASSLSSPSVIGLMYFRRWVPKELGQGMSKK